MLVSIWHTRDVLLFISPTNAIKTKITVNNSEAWMQLKQAKANKMELDQ